MENFSKNETNPITISKLVNVDISKKVSQANARLSKLTNIKRKVGIIRMWPDQAVAEHENIERFRAAFALIGVEIIELDRYGYVLNKKDVVITDEDVDFVIHLHFETGKTYDVTSVAAMWNPVQFYVDWGFKRFWANQMSHDIFAQTGSHEVISMLKTSLGEIADYKLPRLNHTLADPLYEPTKKLNYKAFYCGINWEKITGKKGRHDEILKLLDEKGLVDIYGPEELQGIKVWDGFKGYKGSLPFDGKEVIKKISYAGACLVLSSEAHMDSNIMSNRLFEAMAGGGVVIGDEHPFIRQTIGDNYIYIPSWLSAAERVKIIEHTFEEFALNPEKAIEMAAKAQAVLLDKFLLCDQLVGIYDSVTKFHSDETAVIANAKNNLIDIVVQPNANSVEVITKNLLNIKKKIGAKANIFLFATDDEFEDYKKGLKSQVKVLKSNTKKGFNISINQCINELHPMLKSRKICFWNGTEEIFSNSFITALTQIDEYNVVRLGFGIKHVSQDGNLHIDFQDSSVNIEEIHPSAQSAVIFDTAWLNKHAYSEVLGWNDIAAVSEYKDKRIFNYAKTCLILDLKAFETAFFINPRKTDKDAIKKALTSFLIQSEYSGRESLQIMATQSKYEDKEKINSNYVLDRIKELEPIQKWELTLGLYKSVPMPIWMRKFVTFFRKFVGVK